MQNNILLTLNVLCQVLRDMMLSFPDLRESGLKWLWDSGVLIYFYTFEVFPFAVSCSVVPVTHSFCGGGRFFVRFMFFPAACSTLTQEDPVLSGFKRHVNVALRHGLVVGLAVLDLGFMILKGLFQSKSINFCEIPMVVVKKLECQWKYSLADTSYGLCGYRCNYWVLMKNNNRLLK